VSICNAIDPKQSKEVLSGKQGGIAIVIGYGLFFGEIYVISDRLHSVLKEIASLFERMSAPVPEEETSGFVHVTQLSKKFLKGTKEVASARSTANKIISLRQRLVEACVSVGVSKQAEPPPPPPPLIFP
jgi:hypothetical protein